MATDAISGDLLSLVTGAPTVAGGGGVVGTGRSGREVWDILGDGVLGANVGDANVGGFAGLAQGIISRIEVFPFLARVGYELGEKRKRAGHDKPPGQTGAYLELILKNILFVGHLAIETQETLLLWAQRLESRRQFGSSIAGGQLPTYTDINLVLLMGVHDGQRRRLFWRKYAVEIVARKVGFVLLKKLVNPWERPKAGRGRREREGERERDGRWATKGSPLEKAEWNGETEGRVVNKRVRFSQSQE